MPGGYSHGIELVRGVGAGTILAMSLADPAPWWTAALLCGRLETGMGGGVAL